jgi:branched-chain amino acid transport system permease protein
VYNFAQGAMVLFAALTFVSLLEKWGVSGPGSALFWAALGATLAVMVALAFATERIVLRPLVNQPLIVLFMATLGLSFFIEGLAQGLWGNDVHRLDLGIPDTPINLLNLFGGTSPESAAPAAPAPEIAPEPATDTPAGDEIVIEEVQIAAPSTVRSGGLLVSQFDLFAAAIAGVLVSALALFFSKTRTGRALRAVADDHQAALAVGIPLRQVWTVVWSAAGLLALVAGLLWGSRLGVQFSLSLVVLKALPVLIVGGFTSISGAIVGGLLVGATEKLAEVYVGPLVGGAIENWFPYVLATLFLLVRPHGLFGEKIIERV